MLKGLRDSADRAIGPDRHWVAAQFLLIAMVAIGVPLDARRRRARRSSLRLLAAPVIAVAFWVAGRAKADLAGSFTMSPTPVSDGVLVERGIYGTIRHPMYLSVLMLSVAYALAWGSRLGMLSAIGVFAFLQAKARHEDRILRETYAACAAYQQRVPWAFIPRVL